ncbi:MAG: hypothetical protein JNK21_11305, partial [Rhodospirillaceae bacterium]|nr:hypothetical protein [Rhodospirillaceae bacterium]
KQNWILGFLAVCAFSAVSFKAISLTPFSAISLIAEGVGFDYRPNNFDINCHSNECSLVLADTDLRHEVISPSRLKYSAEGCSKLLNSKPVLTVQDAKKHELSFVFELNSSCDSQKIIERFSVKPGNAVPSNVQSYVRNSLGRWRICVLGPPLEFSCGPQIIDRVDVNREVIESNIESWVNKL